MTCSPASQVVHALHDVWLSRCEKVPVSQDEQVRLLVAVPSVARNEPGTQTAKFEHIEALLVAVKVPSAQATHVRSVPGAAGTSTAEPAAHTGWGTHSLALAVSE